MQGIGFMYGDLDAEPEETIVVRLTGFGGRQKIMAGLRSVLWREFFTGNGGRACQAERAGFALWQPIERN
jgi:hypothetical protein